MDPGSAVSSAGMGLGAVASWTAGRFSAKVDERNARAAQLDGLAEQQQLSDRARQQMGQQIAAQGAAGFQMGTGSNFDALEQSATNRELDLMTIRRQAQSKADGYTLQAGVDRAKAQGALVSGLIGATAALNKGFSDAAYQRQLAGAGGDTSPGATWGFGDAAPDDMSSYRGY